MEQLKETIGNSRKIVIKIGSNVLSDEKGSVNKDVIHNIVFGSRHLRSRSHKQVEPKGRYQLQAGIVRHRSGGTHDGV